MQASITDISIFAAVTMQCSSCHSRLIETVKEPYGSPPASTSPKKLLLEVHSTETTIITKIFPEPLSLSAPGIILKAGGLQHHTG